MLAITDYIWGQCRVYYMAGAWPVRGYTDLDSLPKLRI